MRTPLAIALTLFIVALTGCATPPAEIPVGHWKGAGRFITQRKADAQPQTREYQTRLRIAHTAAVPDGLEFEILSLRGPIPVLDGDRTHLRMILAPAPVDPAAGARGFRLYSIRQAGISFEPNEPRLSPEDAVLPQATCIATPAGLLLQIRYSENFTEHYRFESGRVWKEGQAADDEAFVVWTEELRPAPAHDWE